MIAQIRLPEGFADPTGEHDLSSIWCESQSWDDVRKAHKLEGVRVPVTIYYQGSSCTYARTVARPVYLIPGLAIVLLVDEPEWWGRTLEQCRAALGMPPP